MTPQEIIDEIREMGGAFEDTAARVIRDQQDEIATLRSDLKAIDVALALLGDESVKARDLGHFSLSHGMRHALREIAKVRGDIDEPPEFFHSIPVVVDESMAPDKWAVRVTHGSQQPPATGGADGGNEAENDL